VPNELPEPMDRRSDCGAKSAHHNRTRSSGEQRGTTVKAAQPDEAVPEPFAQVSARPSPKCPQLPKLRILQAWAQSPPAWPARMLWPAAQLDNGAEVVGGTARHTRARSVGARSLVADFRRLRQKGAPNRIRGSLLPNAWLPSRNHRQESKSGSLSGHSDVAVWPPRLVATRSTSRSEPANWAARRLSCPRSAVRSSSTWGACSSSSDAIPSCTASMWSAMREM
jgi:hypothetical protein